MRKLTILAVALTAALGVASTSASAQMMQNQGGWNQGGNWDSNSGQMMRKDGMMMKKKKMSKKQRMMMMKKKKRMMMRDRM